MEIDDAEQHLKYLEAMTKHLKDLEAIKKETVRVENYEAAEVITKSIDLIQSSYVANQSLAKEIAGIKNNLRMYLATNAMNGMLALGIHSDNAIPRYAFDIADAMIAASKE